MHMIYNDAGNPDKSLNQVLLLSSSPLEMLNSCMVSNSESNSILELSRVLIGPKEIKGVGISRGNIDNCLILSSTGSNNLLMDIHRLARIALFTFEDLVVLPDNFTTSDMTCPFALCSIKYISMV